MQAPETVWGFPRKMRAMQSARLETHAQAFFFDLADEQL